MRLSSFLVLAVLGGAALVVAIGARPGDAALAAEVYVLALGAIGLLTAVSRTVGSLPREAATALDRRPESEDAGARPGELVTLEREVALATETAFDAHFRLRPSIRFVAAARLAARAVDLDAPGGAAEALLGPEAWELARPDRPRPLERDLRGVPLSTIEAAVASLERL